MYVLYIVGPAGSGKSALTAALQGEIPDMLEKDTIVVNLDPAVGELPYYPDVDIRSYVDLGELMRQMMLGPNGAMVAALERGIDDPEFIQEILDTGAEIAIVDAPGQLEPFVFRHSGPLLIKSLGGFSAMVFTMDPLLMGNGRDILSLMLLATSVSYRLSMPRIFALTKIDLFPRREIMNILKKLKSPERISADLQLELSRPGVIDRDFVLDMLKLLSGYVGGEVFPVSSKTYEGLDALVAEIERLFFAP